MMNAREELDELIKWCQETFEPGQYLGDVCREDPANLTDDEVMNMTCAREGFLIAQS